MPNKEYRTPDACYRKAPVRRLTTAERHQQQRLATLDVTRQLPKLPKKLPASPFINPIR